MKKSELKQLIKECIQELKDIGGASLDTNVANLKKQLKYFSNVIDYLEGKGDLNGAGKAKKEYHAIKQQLKKLGVNENSSSPTKLDIKRVHDIEVDGIDKRDYPDFCDAYVTSAIYEITKDEFLTTDKSLNPSEVRGKFYRDLSAAELDELNDEYPEIAGEYALENWR